MLIEGSRTIIVWFINIPKHKNKIGESLLTTSGLLLQRTRESCKYKWSWRGESPSERKQYLKDFAGQKKTGTKSRSNYFHKASEDIKSDQCQFLRRGQQQIRQLRNLLLKGSEWGCIIQIRGVCGVLLCDILIRGVDSILVYSNKGCVGIRHIRGRCIPIYNSHTLITQQSQFQSQYIILIY